MVYRIFRLSMVVVSCVLFVGCIPSDDKDVMTVDPSAPVVPPPPTAQDIAREIISNAQLDMPVPTKGARMPKAISKKLLDSLGSAKSQHAHTETGQEAIRHVTIRIEKRIREFTDAQAWTHVLTFLDARAVFDSDNRQYLSLRDEAETQLRKPEVVVKGLPVINGAQFAILSFRIPLTEEKFDNQRMRMGESAFGIRVLSVFGKSRGVMLQYIETGERYVAFLPTSE